jgi:2-aminoadipate transaminase
VKDGFLDQHVPTVRALYKTQCAAMLAALSRAMPEGVEWNEPEGGMFVWLKLPKHIDAMKLLTASVAQNVAFVPGEPFYANEPQRNTMRLCFSTVSVARINEGVDTLARLIAGWPR